MDREVSAFGSEVTPPHPEGHIHQPNQCGNFNERANDTDKCLSGIQAEDGHGYGDRQLEVIASCRKRQGGRLRVICAEPLCPSRS